MARPGAAPAFPIIAPPTTILRSWRRRKNEAIPGQGGLGDRKCWRPPAQAARAAAFCSDLQAPSPLHRAKHKKFVPAGAAAMAPVILENPIHSLGSPMGRTGRSRSWRRSSRAGWIPPPLVFPERSQIRLGRHGVAHRRRTAPRNAARPTAKMNSVEHGEGRGNADPYRGSRSGALWRLTGRGVRADYRRRRGARWADSGAFARTAEGRGVIFFRVMFYDPDQSRPLRRPLLRY